MTSERRSASKGSSSGRVPSSALTSERRSASKGSYGGRVPSSAPTSERRIASKTNHSGTAPSSSQTYEARTASKGSSRGRVPSSAPTSEHRSASKGSATGRLPSSPPTAEHRSASKGSASTRVPSSARTTSERRSTSKGSATGRVPSSARTSTTPRNWNSTAKDFSDSKVAASLSARYRPDSAANLCINRGQSTRQLQAAALAAGRKAHFSCVELRNNTSTAGGGAGGGVPVEEAQSPQPVAAAPVANPAAQPNEPQFEPSPRRQSQAECLPQSGRRRSRIHVVMPSLLQPAGATERPRPAGLSDAAAEVAVRGPSAPGSPSSPNLESVTNRALERSLALMEALRGLGLDVDAPSDACILPVSKAGRVAEGKTVCHTAADAIRRLSVLSVPEDAKDLQETESEPEHEGDFDDDGEEERSEDVDDIILYLPGPSSEAKKVTAEAGVQWDLPETELLDSDSADAPPSQVTGVLPTSETLKTGSRSVPAPRPPMIRKACTVDLHDMTSVRPLAAYTPAAPYHQHHSAMSPLPPPPRMPCRDASSAMPAMSPAVPFAPTTLTRHLTTGAHCNTAPQLVSSLAGASTPQLPGRQPRLLKRTVTITNTYTFA